ncbi:unnamed protein product [Protopolystoma xenopodis]|uniref:Uncharacterized protein n=1 Tax=Protopolystoma xenopodis TaxID=117903 RepID=A0A3S5FC30_9PLAT|nr:unnamed protein product [Protopolystoma xenopodis]
MILSDGILRARLVPTVPAGVYRSLPIDRWLFGQLVLSCLVLLFLTHYFCGTKDCLNRKCWRSCALDAGQRHGVTFYTRWGLFCPISLASAVIDVAAIVVICVVSMDRRLAECGF